MSEENKALIQRWFEEVWNKGRAEAIDEMLAQDVSIYGLSDDKDSPMRGTSVFKAFHQNFRNAFPDIVVTVEDMLAEDDKVAARCLVRSTHLGDGLGIAPTQKPVELTGILIVRIEDGKIVESWNNFDFLSLHRQLGTITDPNA